MLLPELLSKVHELEMVAEHPLMVDVFPGVLSEAQQMSARLTGRRHGREISERLEAIEAKQVNWLRCRTGLKNSMSVI